MELKCQYWNIRMERKHVNIGMLEWIVKMSILER
jgi:hypothetical protein